MSKYKQRFSIKNPSSINKSSKDDKSSILAEKHLNKDGYPRSKVRKQDRKKVDKYLKNRLTVKSDDPIVKFTNFQSYKHIKSRQPLRLSTLSHDSGSVGSKM